MYIVNCLEEDDEEDSPPKKKRFGMNPDVDTTFLPDRDRDDEVRKRGRYPFPHFLRRKRKMIKEKQMKKIFFLFLRLSSSHLISLKK